MLQSRTDMSVFPHTVGVVSEKTEENFGNGKITLNFSSEKIIHTRNYWVKGHKGCLRVYYDFTRVHYDRSRTLGNLSGCRRLNDIAYSRHNEGVLPNSYRIYSTVFQAGVNPLCYRRRLKFERCDEAVQNM